MSQLSSDVLGILKNNFLWQNAFSSTAAFEPEQKQTTADRVAKIATELASIDISGSSGSGRSMAGGALGVHTMGISRSQKFGRSSSGGGSGGGGAIDRSGMLEGIEQRAATVAGSSSSSGGGGGGGEGENTPSLTRATAAGCALAAEHCHHCCSQMAKLALFGNPNMRNNSRNVRNRSGSASARASGSGSGSAGITSAWVPMNI